MGSLSYRRKPPHSVLGHPSKDDAPEFKKTLAGCTIAWRGRGRPLILALPDGLGYSIYWHEG